MGIAGTLSGEAQKEVPMVAGMSREISGRLTAAVAGRPHMVMRKNFTLIELMVVIAIIAILMSMLLPTLGMAKFLAKRIVCLGNHRQIYAATAIYTGDFNGFLPEVNVWDGYRATNYYGGGYGTNEYLTGTIPGGLNTMRKYWGVGKLIETGLLPPSQVVNCTDYRGVDWDDADRNRTWRLPKRLANNDATKGSYALNSAHFYRGPARGRLDGRGPERGGWDEPDKSWYGGVSQVTSLLACSSRSTRSTTNDDWEKFDGAHKRQGFNCTFQDGSGKWLPTSYADWARHDNVAWRLGTSQTNTFGGRPNKGWWPWMVYAASKK